MGGKSRADVGARIAPPADLPTSVRKLRRQSRPSAGVVVHSCAAPLALLQ
ncbi:hypothetical protein J2S49_000557 [Arcanobacterium wilhelmae]|uniref:Uncharacterized protein n=1 Tax=Arcanobacterium wilhelmae TaxID=1803177 RepID=A0ABT9NB79_9ACTO|nr:hypothetical protein [Arcanobacterium wilhelmae]MDP9800481.1 hypothetical protein [Arcanobacterium wilhelmae]WFN89900.1 hypothetical protein P8A24_06805 [Arcanobacterium wilhelmae]